MLDGKLYYAQYSGNVATVWDGTTNVDFWKEDGCGPSAVVPMGENLGITCYDNGKLEVISRDGKTLASYDKDDAGQALQGPNDGVPDGKGGAYFTLSGPWTPGPVVGRIVHLTADGKLRPCLLSNKEIDVKTPLRNGASDEELAELFHDAIREKPEGHSLCRTSGYPAFERTMSQIGG